MSERRLNNLRKVQSKTRKKNVKRKSSNQRVEGKEGEGSVNERDGGVARHEVE